MASQSQSVVNPSPPVGTIQPATAMTTSQPPNSKTNQPIPIAPGFQTIQTSQQQSQQQQKSNNFEPLDKSSSNTLKRNPKMELSKTDLLKLLGYLEGELQARDIVIATLKSEKLKSLLSSRYRSGAGDPHVALMRDIAILGGSMMDSDGNQVDQQVASLEALVTQQRRTQCRMAKVLKDAEIRHRSVIKELEEEKRKHEHDTAQGDDITYGLEKERTRLKKELELERQEKKHLELELKKENDAIEEEKGRQKQIVLLLLAERKKIIMKYIEERKRSEDLAQILSEEKVRIDSMAEGLEEESKKSLQMEAELEKQLAQFDIERQQYRQALAKEEKRSKELEAELERLKAEMEVWKGSTPLRGVPRGVGITPPPPPAKPANLIAMPTLRPAGTQGTIKGAVLGTGTPMVSSKVVQPTATVTSVPVSGPTTGIARSVTPGQALRGVAYGATLPQPIPGETSAPIEAQAGTDKRTVTAATTNPTILAAPVTKMPGGSTPGGTKSPFHATGTGQGTTVVGQVGRTGSTTTMVTSTTTMTTTTTTTTTTTSSTTAKKPLISRGIPPPVPPNKPVVPPKKEAAAYLRRTEPPSSQPTSQPQEAGKFGKVQTAISLGHVPVVHPSTGSVATLTSSSQQQATSQQSSVPAIASVEEVRHP